MKSRKKLMLAILIVTVVAVGVLGFFLIREKDESPYTQLFKPTQEKVDFPIIYPDKANEEFKLNTSSIQVNDSLVIFSYKYGDDQNMVVTQQEKPQKFNTSLLSDSSKIETSKGTAYIADFGGKPRAVILTDKTLVTINDPTVNDTIKLEEFLRNF